MGTRLGACVVLVAALIAPAGAQAAFPGANGDILFSSGGDIQVGPLAGPWAPPAPTPADEAQGAWSPDGTRIAFRGGPESGREVFVMNADGSGRRQLTDTPPPGTYSSQPAWSPDGRRIIFRSNRDGDADPWVMDADGTDVHQVANLPGDDRYPAFAPVGDRIVVRNDSDGDPEIYTFTEGSGGADLLRLTDNAVLDTGPAWSPDGTRIGFERAPRNGLEAPDPAGPADIYVIRADGTGERRLTSDPAHDEGLAWSPDGTRAVFTSERGATSDIWVMDADGSGQAPVTTMATKEESPDWQPLPVARPPAPSPSRPAGAGDPAATARCVRAQPPAIGLRTLARRGLRVRLTCPRPVRVRAVLVLGARRVLARARRGFGARTTTVVLRPSPRARARLRAAGPRALRRVRVLVVATDRSGRSQRSTRALRVTR